MVGGGNSAGQAAVFLSRTAGHVHILVRGDGLAATMSDYLVRRIEEGGIDEVVLAMNATLEGQTTAHYIAEALEPSGVAVTGLAQGVPIGGELDYLDDGTISAALRARRRL